MKEIGKYSKEWFTQNDSLKQKEAIRQLPKSQLDELSKNGSLFEYKINSKLFKGSREKVQNKFNELQKDPQKQKEVELINKLGGIDAIFDIIDADENGKITKAEIADISAVDTSEFSENKNMTFSANDLNIIYENVTYSDDAIIEHDENNITTYTYQGKMKTIIEKDENESIINKKEIIDLGQNSKLENNYNYNTKTTKTILTDNEGRITYEKHEAPGTKNDFTVKIKYNKNSSIKTIETAGRITDVIYDEDENILATNERYKYELKDTPFNQHSLGDCWLLAQVHSLSQSPIGQKIIDESIHQNEDGSVTVELKGAGKTYIYTPEEICAEEYMDTNKRYSTGNSKIKALELAFTDLRKELIDDNNKIKFMIKYSYKANEKDPLNDGYFTEATYFLTGLEPKTAYRRQKIKAELNKKQNNPEQYAMVTSFIKDDSSMGKLINSKLNNKIVNSHEYSITKVTEDTVYVVNPWDTSEEIAYPRDKFMKNCFGVGITDLSELE